MTYRIRPWALIVKRALALKFGLAAAGLGLAALAPISSGPLEASARAGERVSAHPKYCGRVGQRPCKVWEHIPSCVPGAIEKPIGKRCATRPKPKPIIPRPEQVAGCGANGERPCKINQALPSCEGNLVEDFAIGRCRRNDGDFVNMAKNTLREVGPVLSTIANSAVQCGVDTVMLNARNVGPGATVARLQQLPCFNALLDSARSNGYRTLTIGGGGGAAFGVGAEGENGFAFDTAKRNPITTYHTLSLKFLSIGAGATYLPLLVLKSSLTRPVILYRPMSSTSPRSPVLRKPSSVKLALVFSSSLR